VSNGAGFLLCRCLNITTRSNDSYKVSLSEPHFEYTIVETNG